QLTPAVAFNGTNYVLAWDDRRSTPGHIYGARMTPAGSVLDPLGLPLSAGAGTGRPALAYGATEWVVAWAGALFDSDVFGRRLGASIAPIDANDLLLSRGANSETLPSVAFDGAHYLVVWSD